MICLGCSTTNVSQTTLLSMVTAFACMAMTAKSESRSVVIVLRNKVWILRIQENNFSASVLSIDKTVRIFRSSLSFGKEMLFACGLSVRRPRWIHNPTRFLSLPAHTVRDFRKMTARHQMVPLVLQYLSKFQARI